jgi:hypothetical protein
MLPLSVASMTISSLTLNSCIGKQTKHILCQNTQLFLLCSTNFNNSEQLKRSWNVYIHSNPCSPYCTESLASLQHFAVHAPPDTPKPDERETSFRNIIDFSLSQNTKGIIDDFCQANNSTQPKDFVPFNVQALNDDILNLYWGKVGRTVCTISPSWMARRANNPQPCIADLPKHTVFFSVFWNKLIHEHLHQRMKRCTQIDMMHSLIQIGMWKCWLQWNYKS